MAVALVQSDFSAYGADPTQPNLPGAITSGNLLVEASAMRSEDSSFVATATGGATRTTNVEHLVEQLDSTYRRGLAVASAVANGSEPGVTNCSWTTNTSSNVALKLEFSGLTDKSFIDDASNDNGTTPDATSLSSGSTASLSGQVLLVGIYAAKKASSNPSGFSVSWSGDLASPTGSGLVELGSNDICFAYAWKEIAASGTASATADHSASTNDSNNGLTISLVAYQVSGGGGGGSSIPVIMHHRNQM